MIGRTDGWVHIFWDECKTICDVFIFWSVYNFFGWCVGDCTSWLGRFDFLVSLYFFGQWEDNNQLISRTYRCVHTHTSAVENIREPTFQNASAQQCADTRYYLRYTTPPRGRCALHYLTSSSCEPSPDVPSVRAPPSSLRNKRARLGTASAMKDACLGHIDRYAEMYGQHMPHLNATYLYLGSKKVSQCFEPIPLTSTEQRRAGCSH